MRLGAGGVLRLFIDAPDGTFFIQRITTHPVGHVERAIGAEAEADAHDAGIDEARAAHFKGAAFWANGERLHLAGGELVEDEMAVQTRSERSPWLVGEACGAVRVVREWWGDEERLLCAGIPNAFAHPAALLLHVLVGAAPAGVALLGDVNEALLFAGHVGIVVHAEHVAQVIEGDLLDVAQAVGKDLEAAAVGLDSHHGAFMRVKPVFAFVARHVHAFVANTPVDTTIEPEARSMHVVPGVGDVHSEAMRDHFAHIGDAVIVGVFEPPEIRRDGGIDPAVMIQNARRDAGDFGVKSFGEGRHLVGSAIAIRVAELVDALAMNGEVLPVDGAVFVMILQPTARQAKFSWSQLPLQELALLLHTAEPDIIRDPHRMLTDVEIRTLSPRGGGDIDASLFIHRAGNRIRHIQSAGPAMKSDFGSRGCLSKKKEEGEATHDGGEYDCGELIATFHPRNGVAQSLTSSQTPRALCLHDPKLAAGCLLQLR